MANPWQPKALAPNQITFSTVGYFLGAIHSSTVDNYRGGKLGVIVWEYKEIFWERK